MVNMSLCCAIALLVFPNAVRDDTLLDKKTGATFAQLLDGTVADLAIRSALNIQFFDDRTKPQAFS